MDGSLLSFQLMFAEFMTVDWLEVELRATGILESRNLIKIVLD